MADISLCNSAAACRVALRCYRNPAAPGGAQPSDVRQPSGDWHPESGPACPGFIDLRAPDANHPYGLEHPVAQHG
jgi:hypothetical protein